MTSLETLTHADFAPVESQPFVLEQTTLMLESAQLLSQMRAGASRAPFSLLFSGPPGLRLQQGIHTMSHASLGTLAIFITQVGDGPNGSKFEAIFT